MLKLRKIALSLTASGLLISSIPNAAAAGIVYMEPVAGGVSLSAVATAGDRAGGSYLIGGSAALLAFASAFEVGFAVALCPLATYATDTFWTALQRFKV